MKKIAELVKEFKEGDCTFTQSERSSIIKTCVDEFGIEKVSAATGYKLSTLVAICNDKKNSILISDVKVRQARYVFNRLNVE